MKSPVSTFGFINAKLRGRLSKMIPDETYAQMMDASSLEETVRILASTSYATAAQVYQETGDLLMTELEIRRVEENSLHDAERYARQFTVPAVADFMGAILMRFELENLKNALRLWFERTIRGRSVEAKLPYLVRGSGISGLSLDTLVNTDSAGDLLILTDSTPFASIFREHLPPVATDRSLFSLEVALDRWYYAILLASAKALGSRDRSLARRLIGIEIDTINVNWVVRRQMFYAKKDNGIGVSLISGGLAVNRGTLEEAMTSRHPYRQLTRILDDRSGLPTDDPTSGDETSGSSSSRSLAFLEKLLQQQLEYECRRILGGYPFSIGIMLAYFTRVRQESRRIVTIINGKYYEMASGELEALL